MKVNSDPQWQAMVAAIVKNHAEGDVITHGELNTLLRLEEPDYADYQDQAEYKKAMTTYAFVRLSTIEQLKYDLLVGHKCYIKNVAGEGYRIVSAKDQAAVAYNVAVRNIHDEFEQGALVMENVRETALNAEEKKKTNDYKAKLALLQQMFENNRKP